MPNEQARGALRILTHRADYYGKCLWCGMVLPELPNKKVMLPGEFIGVIESASAGVSSYRVGKHDSNRRCDQ